MDLGIPLDLVALELRPVEVNDGESGLQGNMEGIVYLSIVVVFAPIEPEDAGSQQLLNLIFPLRYCNCREIVSTYVYVHTRSSSVDRHVCACDHYNPQPRIAKLQHISQKDMSSNKYLVTRVNCNVKYFVVSLETLSLLRMYNTHHCSKLGANDLKYGCTHTYARGCGTWLV